MKNDEPFLVGSTVDYGNYQNIYAKIENHVEKH
jgi:hypothetical protein